jgi:hypothetical protein
MTEGLARRVVRGTARATLTGATAALGAWAATAGVREMLRRRADEALQLAAQTPLGRVLPEPEMPDDGAEDEAARIADAARAATRRASDTLRDAAAEDSPVDDDRAAAATAGTDDAQPADDAPATDLPTAADIGAPGTAAPTAEAVTEQLLREHSVPAEPSRADLPIADFDNAGIASLRARLRSLSIEDLVVLREWELAHAHRLPVLTMLDNRIAKLQSAAG